MEASVPLLLVDEHAPLLIWLQSMLPFHGFGPVTAVGTVDDAVEALGDDGIACVGDLGDVPAAAVVRRLLAASPGARVIAYVKTPTGDASAAALAAGATAVCLKNGRLSDLLVALEHAAEGRRYVDPRISVSCA